MDNSTPKVKALGLCSGGLDSMLAALVLKRQMINVTWVSFETPFFSSANARKASEHTGIPLIVKQITPVYMEMLKNPRAGYGKNMNPCMDCHALMFRLAGEIMAKDRYDFLFSGEVVGQRPMSQRKQAMRYVEKHSGMEGVILRPLSAKLLPETEAEKSGLVDRSRLLDISGRSRKPQIELAGEFGITEYPAPAGGCLLTDPGYSRRLRDLFDHEQDIQETDLHLLKYGRHLRMHANLKLVVGRNQKENNEIESLAFSNPNRYILLCPQSFAGPRVVAPKTASPEDLKEAAAICVGYSKVPLGEVMMHSGPSHGENKITVTGRSPDDLRPFIII